MLYSGNNNVKTNIKIGEFHILNSLNLVLLLSLPLLLSLDDENDVIIWIHVRVFPHLFGKGNDENDAELRIFISSLLL